MCLGHSYSSCLEYIEDIYFWWYHFTVENVNFIHIAYDKIQKAFILSQAVNSMHIKYV